ncbi:hypothetical protein KCP78_08050 [Salmonella enterica subsp. enterica]|nr:hypothetical protein KCP78_08050 [Salmonella enterica subsp. enterica]
MTPLLRADCRPRYAYSLLFDDFLRPPLSVFTGLLPFSRLKSSGAHFHQLSDCAAWCRLVLAVFPMMAGLLKRARLFLMPLCGTGALPCREHRRHGRRKEPRTPPGWLAIAARSLTSILIIRGSTIHQLSADSRQMSARRCATRICLGNWKPALPRYSLAHELFNSRVAPRPQEGDVLRADNERSASAFGQIPVSASRRFGFVRSAFLA